jgi:site-specific DNA-adenine methylase
MKYIGIPDAAQKWNITRRRVQLLCSQSRIEGACKIGNIWAIPEEATYPKDARKKVEPIQESIQRPLVQIERIWSMPNKNTFEIKPIKALIAEEMTDGAWIDPFANRNKLASVTNDLNTECDTNYHLDALDFLKMFDTESVDGVLYDPPFSPRQVSECYNDVGYNVTWDMTKASFWGNHKREISRIVKSGGKVITFGWNSGGIGMKYGFDISRILLVPHGGWHNDTICTVEVKTHNARYVKPVVDLGTSRKPLTAESTDNDKALVAALSNLPPDYWDFKTDDTREYTHGLHSYPAMMVCPISRNIISLVKGIQPVRSLFDPFAGSGTVLVEGILADIKMIAGNDINPLALFLSKVKTTPIAAETLQSEVEVFNERLQSRYIELFDFISKANAYVEQELGLDVTAKDGWAMSAPKILTQYCEQTGIAMDVPNFKNIGYWFKPSVILELALIKNEILNIQNEAVKRFVFVAFSESIRLVSNRRNGEFKMFRMPIEKVRRFSPSVRDEFQTILKRNIRKMYEFVTTFYEMPSSSTVEIYSDNVCKLISIANDTYDLVITSPPYGDSRTTVAYGEFSRLSLQWIDLFELDENVIMRIDHSLMGGTKYRNGFEFKLPSDTLRQSLEKIKDLDIERAGDVYSFYDDLYKAIGQITKKTTIDGYQFWVVGNRTVKGELLKTDIIIQEFAASCGLQYVYSVDRNISNKVMPSKNSPTNEVGAKSTTMTNEHIVILRKQ